MELRLEEGFPTYVFGQVLERELAQSGKGMGINMIKWFQGMLAAAAVVFGVWISTVTGLAAEITVTADTAKIRAEANTGSTVVGSTTKGSKIDIEGETTDSAGIVWYKVSVGGNQYGYIRSDLVEKSGASDSASSSTNAGTAQTSSPKPADTVPTPITEQDATISQTSVRIRSGASTTHDTVASLPQGTVVKLTGEAKDSAGKTWYQMSCTYNNKNVVGYIRSDLVTLGGAVGENNTGEATEITDPNGGEPAEENSDGNIGSNPGEEDEEVPAEETQENVPPENNDYEIVYAQNNDGEFEYYLNDNIENTARKLGDLLSAVDTANSNFEIMQKQINNQKIIIIILAVLIIVLVLTVTLLLFKIRDLYYDDDYDDEDEEEEIEEAIPKKKTARRGEEVRTKRVSDGAGRSEHGPVRRASNTAASERKVQKSYPPELRAAEAERPVKKPSSTRKPQNFLKDDDEFEFEFLNMDERDL